MWPARAGEARRILGAQPSPEDRAQAEELLRRTQTPPPSTASPRW